MRWMCNLVYMIALVVALPWLLFRSFRTGRYRRGIAAKLLGRQPLPEAPGCVWFHGVSVGEIHLLRQVVGEFRSRFPHVPVVISSTTDTGFDEASRIFEDVHVIRFPFDFSWAVARTMRALQPSLVVLVESEVWPNFLMTAKKLGVPVALVNGRMSPRTSRRYGYVAPIARFLFGHFDLLAMQSDEYARHLLGLGVNASKVYVTGNVKYDGVESDRSNARTRSFAELFGIGPDDRVWVAGSTQAPEEEIVLRVFDEVREDHPELRLILVPRHPERFDEVARLLDQRNSNYVRRSSLDGPALDREIILVDTLGELSAVWGLADLAFVGGSMDGKRGGQNMIEPAAFGAAVFFGPHVWNFRETVRQLLERSAARQVEDEQSLLRSIRDLLTDESSRRTVGERARSFVETQQGATGRTLDLLAELLDRNPRSRKAA